MDRLDPELEARAGAESVGERGDAAADGTLPGTPGSRTPQALLGHADVGTTLIYTGAPTLDELAAAIKGADWNRTAGVSSHALEPNLAACFERHAAAAVALYRPLFESGGVA